MTATTLAGALTRLRSLPAEPAGKVVRSAIDGVPRGELPGMDVLTIGGSGRLAEVEQGVADWAPRTGWC